VDFSGRTVISPDPNLGVDEVGLPLRMAMRLTFPEAVHERNLAELRRAVACGPNKYPGASTVRRANGSAQALSFCQNLRKAAEDLKLGDVVVGARLGAEG
jgi:DNA-directed RNA polymerase III subunit RPC1